MRLRQLYYIVIPLLIILVTLGITSFSITLFLLLPLLITSNRHTVSVFLMMYGGVLGGVIRTAYPFIPVYGVLLQFLGVVFAWDTIRDLFIHNKKTVLLVIITILLFGFYFILGPMDDFAREKYLSMTIMAFLSLFGYYTLCYSSKVDAESLIQILLVSGLCLYSFVITQYSLSPEGLFDYNWFRKQSTALNNVDELLIDHQQIAMLIVYGLAVFLAKVRINPLLLAFYSLCSFQLVMTSGCRQAIFSVLILVAVRIFVFRPENAGRNRTLIRIIWVLLGVLISYLAITFILENISSEMVTKAMEGEDERTVLMLTALKVFEDNPILGVGLGGYQSTTGFLYPHNIILEIMSECGIVGILVFGMMLLLPLVFRRVRLLQLTNSSLFFNLIVFALILRVMVSSDLKESISLFSAVYAIAAVSGKKKIE